MSRSKARTKAMKPGGRNMSEKKGKKQANKKFRRREEMAVKKKGLNETGEPDYYVYVKVAEAKGNEVKMMKKFVRIPNTAPETDVPKKLKEVSSTYDFPSDGLATYNSEMEEKWMRK